MVHRVSNPDKVNSPVWQGLKPYKGKIRTNGERGKHRRYYEWDHTHNDTEVYKQKGRNILHIGSMDPVTGKLYKPAVKGRQK